MSILKSLLNKLNIRKLNFKSKGENVFISSRNSFQSPQTIEIGDNIYFGPDSRFVGHGGIKIGSGTIFAHNIEIQSRNHNFDSPSLESIPYDKEYIHKPVIIGENVWIGAHVKIVPGVSIGEGAVIGMGSIVTKDVPSFAVIGGNPAKILKYRDKELYLKLKFENKIYMKLKKQ